MVSFLSGLCFRHSAREPNLRIIDGTTYQILLRLTQDSNLQLEPLAEPTQGNSNNYVV